MSRWIHENPAPEKKGITVPILTDGRGQWKRDDAFGHNSDKTTHEYKMARRTRGIYHEYAEACDKTPPEFDEWGGLVQS